MAEDKKAEQIERDLEGARVRLDETVDHLRIKATKKKPSETGARKPQPRGKKKDDLWLEKLEAYYVSLALQFVAFARYGVQPEIPDEREREHLAHVLKRASTVPPLSWLQVALKRLMPLGSPESVPGRSLPGDLAQYAWAWHRHNPELYLTVLEAENMYVPFINAPPPGMFPQPEVVPTAPPRNMVEGKFGRRFTDAEWREWLVANGYPPEER